MATELENTLQFWEDKAAEYKLPPGTYSAKMVKILPTHLVYQVASGRYSGRVFIVPKKISMPCT